MFSQFERQYKDFLKNHLIDLNVKENRSSEESILTHINSHLKSSSSNSNFTPKLTKSCKSDELAQAHVNFAIELVGRNGHVLALAELCEAIKNSTSTETLVLIVATRIVVLFKLKLIHELRSDLRLLKSICCNTCIKTIFGTKPGNQKSNVQSKNTDQFSPITNKFGPIERCSLTKPQRKKLREINNSVSRKTAQNNTSHNPPRPCTLPSLLTTTVLSEEYNFVTSKLRIDQSEERGRFVVAEQDLHIGDVLAVEEASVWTVLPQRWSSHCQLCLNVCRAPLPCLKCPDVVYCSMGCLNGDFVHQMECGYLSDLQSLPKMIYLAFRTVLKYRNEIVLYSRNKDTSQDFQQLINLITNFDLRSPVDLIRRTTLAIFLSNIIKILPVFIPNNKYSFINRPDRTEQGGTDAPDLGKSDNTEGEGYESEESLMCSSFSVGEVDICVPSSLELSRINDAVQFVLLKCLQSYPCNAHEISELQIAQELRFSVNEDIGAGAFPFLSLLNHSCNPNVVRHSVGKKTVLRALREIKAGEEIQDNYGYHYATHTVPERKRALRTQYLFTCACVPCTDRKRWPTFDDVPNRVTIRCSRCDASLLTKRTMCDSCGKNATKPFQRMDWLATETNKFIQKFITDGDAGSSSTIFEFLKMCEKHAELPFRLHNESQEVVKQIWNLQSNCNKPLS